MITTQTIDGLQIASETLGEGIPVLLLHGWGGSIESMTIVAERLAPLGYACHVLDLPGFGRSTLPKEIWGVEDYAHLVTHYLDTVALKRVNLIGHSFGGRVSIVLGGDYPDLIDKIVLADSAGVVPTPTANQVIRQTMFGAAGAALKLPGINSFEGKFRSWAKKRYGSEDLKNAGPLEPIFRKVIVEDLLPHAARIKAPTLLIWGDADTTTPLSEGQTLEKTIPDAGLVVFNGATHFAYQERLADFVRIVDTFFAGKR